MTVTESPSRVDAVAGVSAQPHGPAILLPRRRPGYLGPVHLTQLLLAEFVLVAVLATVTREIPVAVGTAVGGGLLLLVALGRRNGRWWVERRLMRWRYRRRGRGASPTAHDDDPRLVALHRLAPALAVQDVAVSGGTQVGVARDDAGWFAVAAITSNSTMRDQTGALPLDVMVAALAEAEQPGAVLQVVIQAVPAPRSEGAAPTPAADSYRQLLATFGWIAVRLDARTLAVALGDHCADVDPAPAVVAALIRRVAKSLRPYGISYRLLDGDGLLSALVRSVDLDVSMIGAEPKPPREDWSTWHSSRFAHRCFWIRRWPPVDRATGLLDWLFSVPTATTSVALILAPEEGEQMVDLKALVRVTAPAAQLQAVCHLLTRGAVKAKGELFPLDGEQSPAAYASAPTGGGAR
jgi:type VII secretion protein EccE